MSWEGIIDGRAQVESVRAAAEDHVELVLSIDEERAREHVHPGQFVALELPGVGHAPFAIASAPCPPDARFHFLLKRGSELPNALSVLSPGDGIRIGHPMGKGFPLEKALGGRRLLLFATGSGISAIRSVLASLAPVRDRVGEITLYYGARTPEAFAYLDELHAETMRGLRLIKTVSRPGDSGWEGLTGHVQSHIEEIPLGGAVAFLCGQSAMVKEVSKILVSRGVRPDEIFLNY